MAALPPDVQSEIERISCALQKNLQANLHSCILYGSAVRGNFVPGVSDLNLLIVLQESTPEAHAVIAQALQSKIVIEPFVLGLEGLERSMRAFAIKFMSIRRNYKLLHGTDVLRNVPSDEALLRFLCEQAVRNLRLRLVHAFITFGGNRKRYANYLVQTLPAVFTDISEVLRCADFEIPQDYPARLQLIEKELGTDVSVLKELLELKAKPRELSAEDAIRFHGGLFRILNHTVKWMESKWPQQPFADS